MKIAIVGCGKQAPKHIAGLRSGQYDVEIVVFDVKRQCAEQLAKSHDVIIADSLETILSDSTVSGVIIATPTPFHYDVIVQSLKADKHVFCEKPLCESIEQAEILQSAMRESGKFIQVGYVYRQVPAFRELKKLLSVQNKPMGQPVSALLRIGGRGSHSLWKHRKDTGGGAINEMLVHMLDLSYWLFGGIETVYAIERKLLSPTRVINGQKVEVDAEDFVLMSAKSANGTHIVFQADLLTPAFRQYIEVQSENGSFIGSIQSEMPSYVHLLKPAGEFSAGRHDFASDQVNLFHSQMQEFLANIFQGKLIDSPSIIDSIHLFSTLAQLENNTTTSTRQFEPA